MPPASRAAAKQIANFGTCGGLNMCGRDAVCDTSCSAGWKCQKLNSWFWQCLKDDGLMSAPSASSTGSKTPSSKRSPPPAKALPKRPPPPKASTKAPTPSPTPTPTPSTSSSVLAPGAQCGGSSGACSPYCFDVAWPSKQCSAGHACTRQTASRWACTAGGTSTVGVSSKPAASPPPGKTIVAAPKGSE